MREEIAGHRQSAKSSNIISKKYRRKADEAEAEKKLADRKLLKISREQKAADETKKATAWSAAAAICVSIFYEICKVHGVGYPGGNRFASVWTHEAMIACCTWFATVVFGLLHKIAHGK